MKRGLFITFEGPDGSGKSTQIQKLNTFLQEQGHDTLLTREPGGTAISEKIRGLILDPAHKEMDPMAEALLYASSRAQLVSQVIKPALEAGKTVICDRYVDSSVAYQGYGRGLGESVEIINRYAVQGIMPDLTVLLLLDPASGRKRVQQAGEMDRLEQEALEFHQRVYDGYVRLAETYPERILSFSAKGEIEAIAEAIRSRTAEALEKL
ncbi:MAG: dTMP kinase [Clostridiales bacterium]|nr:dTMP kinase [Clostridiales bacterium]MBQ3107043.1 dTMP kinase [Bacillota bacterium]